MACSVDLFGRIEKHAHFKRGRKFEDDLLQGEVVKNLLLGNARERQRVELLALQHAQVMTDK